MLPRIWLLAVFGTGDLDQLAPEFFTFFRLGVVLTTSLHSFILVIKVSDHTNGFTLTQ